jgi:hypothetical protein
VADHAHEVRVVHSSRRNALRSGVQTRFLKWTGIAGRGRQQAAYMGRIGLIVWRPRHSPMMAQHSIGMRPQGATSNERPNDTNVVAHMQRAQVG